MSDLPQGFYVGDLYCFPIGKEGAGEFGYIPGPPRIESVGGEAIASLLNTVKAGVLALQAVWTADPRAVEAAEQEILRRHPGAGRVSLTVAPVSGTTASLTVTADGGAAHTFGPVVTSGPDAFRVVFSETLTQSEKEAAVSAFGGRTGVLQLRYDGVLEMEEASAGVLSGDLAEEMKSLAPRKPEIKSGGLFGSKHDPEPPPPPDLAACAQGVERALRNGQLTLVHEDTPNVSAEARRKMDEELRQAAAVQLHDQLVRLGPDAVYMTSFSVRQQARVPERVSFPVSRTGDLGEWLAGNGGRQLVTSMNASMPDPGR